MLETSFILIKTCCILKCFVQRKDLKMYPRKFMSCLPYERIKDHNLSRVWQLYSLEHMQSHATLTNIHVFCLQDATICYATNVHTQRTIWRLALTGEPRHIFFPFEISPRWMIPFFPNPSVGCSVVPVPGYISWFNCCSRQLNSTSAVSRQSQKQENQCSGEVLKCAIVT